MISVLVIDDESTLRGLISRVLQLEGYAVVQAANLGDALKILRRETIHVVVTDVKLPDGNGVDFTAKIKKEFPATEVIVITAFGTIEDGVKAIQNGAFNYLTKGDHQEKIIPLLSQASEKALLQQKVVSLEARLRNKFGFETILGTHTRIEESIKLAKKVAPTDTTVMLLGETGTGKEVFAQAIHYESLRSSKSFVALNCSAFAKDLLESELFGHAEGAYTGATKATKGYLEEADHGTLFLDEIGEMNIDLQAKLLRVIETGEYYRVGESKSRKVDVRFVAATNRNLEKESEEGSFRKDLFYRLSVFVISLPALRERKSDIRPLAEYFIKQFSVKTNRQPPFISESFFTTLENHSWKGNIRELKNVIERTIILADDEINDKILPMDFLTDATSNSLDLASAEKLHIQKVLNYANGNKTQAAKLLEIGLTTLYQKIKDYNL